jgi:hypothetical protein
MQLSYLTHPHTHTCKEYNTYPTLIKLKNLEAVKDLPKLSKPLDSVCKPCLVGKLTRTRFKSKELYVNRETTPISSYGFIWTIKTRRHREGKLLHADH